MSRSFRILTLNFTFTIFLLTSCSTPPAKENIIDSTSNTDSGPKEGTHHKYYENGNVKVTVNYKNGKKHGLSSLYYESGHIQLEIPYLDGKREGISRKYYESGVLYAETSYENNMVNGFRKTYFSNGKIKAIIPYKNNLVGVGLKEYTTKGKELSNNEIIGTKTKKGIWEISTNKKCNKVVYFSGSLMENKYLNEKQLKVISVKNNKGILNSSGNVVCKCTTAQGNILILQKSF